MKSLWFVALFVMGNVGVVHGQVYPAYEEVLPEYSAPEGAPKVHVSHPVRPAIGIPYGEMLEEAYAVIETRYIFADELTPEMRRRMTEAAVAAMVQEMGDQYAEYVPESKLQEALEQVDGQYEGIGAYMEERDGEVYVTAPIKGSPAEAAGLEPGDKIVSVNGRKVAGESVQRVSEWIRGEAGTPVVVGYERGDRVWLADMVRSAIRIPSVTMEWVGPNQDVPYIGVHQFVGDTVEDFARVVRDELGGRTPEVLVLDVRNNPGGYVEGALQLGSYFAEEGEVLMTATDRQEHYAHVATEDGALAGVGRVYVLHNAGTASASEMLIGMLESAVDTVRIGEETFGKGVIQTFVPLEAGGMVKLTTDVWRAPSGRWVSENPYEPEIRVEEQEEVLDRAIEEAVKYREI